MKEIQLSKFGKNKGKYIALVDDEDFDMLNQFNWSVAFSRNTFYAMRKQCSPERKTIRMHRFIFNINDPNIIIDHKNRNGLDCQRKNLRICTHSQNSKNKKASGSSKYLGVTVYMNKIRRKILIRAQINNGEKMVTLGYFNNEIEAAAAYNEAAIKYHGEFANLNDLTPDPGTKKGL
jgi:hypothetical protein